MFKLKSQTVNIETINKCEPKFKNTAHRKINQENAKAELWKTVDYCLNAQRSLLCHQPCSLNQNFQLKGNCIYLNSIEVEIQIFLQSENIFSDNQEFKLLVRAYFAKKFKFQQEIQDIQFQNYIEFSKIFESENGCEKTKMRILYSYTDGIIINFKQKQDEKIFLAKKFHLKNFDVGKLTLSLESECQRPDVFLQKYPNLQEDIAHLLKGEIEGHAVVRAFHPFDKKCCITWRETDYSDLPQIFIEYEISSIESEPLALKYIDDFISIFDSFETSWFYTMKQLDIFKSCQSKDFLKRPKVFTPPCSQFIQHFEKKKRNVALKWDGVQHFMVFEVNAKNLVVHIFPSHFEKGTFFEIKLCSDLLKRAKCLSNFVFSIEKFSKFLVVVDVNCFFSKKYTLCERLELLTYLLNQNVLEVLNKLITDQYGTNALVVCLQQWFQIDHDDLSSFLKSENKTNFVVENFRNFKEKNKNIPSYSEDEILSMVDGVLVYFEEFDAIFKVKFFATVDLFFAKDFKLYTSNKAEVSEIDTKILSEKYTENVLEFSLHIEKLETSTPVFKAKFLRIRNDKFLPNSWVEICDLLRLLLPANKCAICKNGQFL